MKYVPRPGIVLTKICGQNVLIPARAAYASCRVILRLAPLWAMTWEQFGKEDAEDRILKLHRILTKKPDDEIRTLLNAFCEEMAARGFMIENPEEEAPGEETPENTPEE